MISSWPPTNMWIGPPDSAYLKAACVRDCHCVRNPNAEAPPTIPDPRRPAESLAAGVVPSGGRLSASSGTSTASSASGSSIGDEYEHECLEFYGHSVVADCDEVLDEIKNLPEQELLREFIRPGGELDPSWHRERPHSTVPVNTPKSFVHGKSYGVLHEFIANGGQQVRATP